MNGMVVKRSVNVKSCVAKIGMCSAQYRTEKAKLWSAVRGYGVRCEGTVVNEEYSMGKGWWSLG